MVQQQDNVLRLTATRRRRLAEARDYIIGIGLLGSVAALDWATGPGVDFSLFYLLPVSFLAWRRGGRVGYATSFIAAIIWLYVDGKTGAKSSDGLLATWSLALRVLFFACSVHVVQSRRIDEVRLAELVEQRTVALRALAVQLSSAEEIERRKLAHAIHDSVSQTLTITKINLDSTLLNGRVDAALASRLSTCSAMLDDAIKQTRTLMFDLHPAMLDDLGLSATLRWFAGEFSKRTGSDMMMSEQGSGHPLTLGATEAGYLFRAVKELAANAVKHGRAKSIIVTARWSAGGLRLTVDDDGCGFQPTALIPRGEARRGFGLVGTEERIRSMGGSMTVESNPGQGTRVVIEVPLAAVEQEGRDAPARLAG